ncbi:MULTISPECIES: hypothetical protein, partial [Enterobacteriaceae]
KYNYIFIFLIQLRKYLMKRLIALALLCALSGCAQNTLPSAFSGKGEPVNTSQIMAELNSHE